MQYMLDAVRSASLFQQRLSSIPQNRTQDTRRAVVCITRVSVSGVCFTTHVQTGFSELARQENYDCAHSETHRTESCVAVGVRSAAAAAAGARGV